MNTIETKRLTLRPWEESDAEALFKYASDPEVGPRAGWPPHKDIEESTTIIRDVFSCPTMWAVELKTTGEVIGCVGYLPSDACNLEIGENEAEVGYWIGKPYWNMGICTEAMAAIVDYCFNVLGLEVLWGDYFTDNPSSGRVMRKLGFRDTGEETVLPKLEVGSDRLVRVMRLDYAL